MQAPHPLLKKSLILCLSGPRMTIGATSRGAAVESLGSAARANSLTSHQVTFVNLTHFPDNVSLAYHAGALGAIKIDKK